MASISFIIPTIGRPSLQRTLASIDKYSDDEVIVVEDIPPTRMWGNPQRNEGMEKATCDYLAFIDDDDHYVPGHRGMMEHAINECNGMCPILFKMQYPNGDFLWKEKRVIPGNIGSPMILVPNKKDMLYHWPGKRNMADFLFVDKWKWKKDEIIWKDEVIAYLGHNNIGDIHHE